MIKDNPRYAELNTFKKRIYSEDVAEYEAIRAKYRQDWTLFVREVLGATPYPYQDEIIRQLQRDRRLSVKALRGVGKTTVAAWIVLAVVTLYGDENDSENDVKVVCTAGRYRQLKEYLFPEIRKWAFKGDFSKIGIELREGKELLQMGIYLKNRSVFGASPDKPEGIEGAHARNMLLIVDEAKLTPNEVWDAMEGAFSSNTDDDSNVWVFSISTPGAPTGRFYEIMSGRRGYEDWSKYNISYAQAVSAGRIDTEWAANRKRQWGEDDPRYQNQVLGEFADSSEYSVFKLSWIEAAIERWYDLQDTPKEGRLAFGVDPADTGEDLTAIAKWTGSYLEWVHTYDAEVMQTIPLVQRLLGAVTIAPIGIDSIGVGAGAYQEMRKRGYKVRAIKSSASAKDNVGLPVMDAYRQNTFKNLRSAMYWNLRDALDPHSPVHVPIAIPPGTYKEGKFQINDMIKDELLAHEWKVVNGVIHVLPKDDVKDKIGHSPDHSDAIVYGWYMRHEGRRKVSAKRL